jgi:hypothetical protein
VDFGADAGIRGGSALDSITLFTTFSRRRPMSLAESRIGCVCPNSNSDGVDVSRLDECPGHAVDDDVWKRAASRSDYGDAARHCLHRRDRERLDELTRGDGCHVACTPERRHVRNVA